MKMSCLLLPIVLLVSMVLAVSAQVDPTTGLAAEAIGDQPASTQPGGQPQPTTAADATPPPNTLQPDPNATTPPPVATQAAGVVVTAPVSAPAMAAGSVSDAGTGSGSLGMDQTVVAPRRRHKSTDDDGTPAPTSTVPRDKSGAVRGEAGPAVVACVAGLLAALAAA